MIAPCVATGLDRLCRTRFRALRGRRVGLLANQAAVNHELLHVIDLLHEAPGVELVRLFGPEHGLRGEAQDMEAVGSGQDRKTGLPIVSLYGDRVESLKPRPDDLEGLDVVVADLPDIGSRYYTFAATLFFLMETAAEVGASVLVLDRPNPIGGVEVEGPAIRPGFESFVGVQDVPNRHGLTLGEWARLYQADRGFDLDLEILRCEGWTREMRWRDTGLPWVPPSPNMPTPETALVYPGGCLLEATNLSEGRGTTRPFEFWGAPWLEPHLERLEAAVEDQLGVRFRACSFQPVFHKHANTRCFGLFPHVVDAEAFRPLGCYLGLIAATAIADHEHFSWRTEPYEFVSDRPAIDLLFGSDRERRAIDDLTRYDHRTDLRRWVADQATRWRTDEAAFRERRRPFLLYTARGWSMADG